ncbi:tetratricopeptide repeat protein 33-like isoform X2 [Hibiscus syriacus]|uniref:tetratricopeptide repeat protein 33-like isoform X2 n=1 Tax=Hibiscus syriacus TaxID=106335 RepID=UPI001922027E|nr:tetratricopeptide repeat protein 33-like isoform X2 [Hibiscus syriacus]
MKLTWNKKKNNKKRSIEAIASYPNLPFDGQQPSADNTQFQNQEPAASQNQEKPSADALDSDFKLLAQSFQDQGNKLAEDGKYREALGKWEAALNLMPENAVLFEQKAQVLLELGDAWSALKAASRATELESSCGLRYVKLVS